MGSADSSDVPGWVDDVGSPGAVVLLTVGALVLFWGLSVVVEERFVPALSVLSERFAIPDDVAGATLMAAGASSPEVFSSLVSLFITHSSLGAGTVIGSEQFNLLGICAGSVLYAKGGKLVLDRKILAREALFYLMSLVLLLVALTLEDTTIHGHKHVVVRWPSACVLLSVYLAYVYVCAYFEGIVAWWEGRWCGTSAERATMAKKADEKADAEVEQRLRAFHVLQIEHEPEANFDAEEESGGYASVGTVEDPPARVEVEEEKEEEVRRPTLARLNSTATMLVETMGLASTKDQLEEVVDFVPSLFACYLFRSNRFYSRAKISKNAWELRWVVFRKDSRELHTFRDRADADQVDFWTHCGARRYHLLGLKAYDHARGLLELDLDPIGRFENQEFDPQLGYFLAPSKHVLEAFLREVQPVLEVDPPSSRRPIELSRTVSNFGEGAAPAKDEDSLVEWPRNASCWLAAAHVALFPAKLAMHLTILDVRTRTVPSGLDAVLASLECVVWLAIMSLAMCSCCETIGAILGISDAVLGITFSAVRRLRLSDPDVGGAQVGTSLPNLIGSMVRVVGTSATLYFCAGRRPPRARQHGRLQRARWVAVLRPRDAPRRLQHV